MERVTNFWKTQRQRWKRFENSGTRIDLFTFIQKLSDTSPKYGYPMEWDNMAALRVSSFDDWMKHQD